MLLKLKRKFIAISMFLVSFVLLIILICIYAINYKTIEIRTESNLVKTTNEILESQTYPENIIDGNSYPTFVYRVEENSYRFINSNTRQMLEKDAVSSILSTASKSKNTNGLIKNYGIRYLRSKDDSGNYYISIAYIGNDLENLNALARMLVTAFAVAFVLMFFIARYLANWALEPVEEAWVSQKQFIADASHELKTPLTVMLANFKILKKYNNLEPEQSKWIDNSNDEALRMKDLVEEMLYLAKGDLEENTLNYSEINISELVEEVLLTFESIAFEKGLNLEYENIEENLHVKGDRSQLKRLIIILVDNACKYSEEGNNIDIDLRRNDKKIIFKITSIGNIIKKENSNKIFERFVRESESRERNGEGGYGLGLAIAQKIAINHKGKIKWEAYKDIGNTFIVELEA